MKSFKTQHGCIPDGSVLTLHIIFDAQWAAMNVRSKHPIAWNNFGHAWLWRFYLHYGIEETGCPGSKCIICHQVLRHPSEHGTCSLGKHMLAKAHIAKLNELTESEVMEFVLFNGWWNTFGHTEQARMSRNYNCKFAKTIHIWHLYLVNIDSTDTQSAPNWQRRTFKLPNFTKTPEMATSY